MTISELVEKYHLDRSRCLRPDYNETQLRNDYLDPLFELLGWDIRNSSGKAFSEREVILEEALRASASENSKKPDYTFRLFAERRFFLEAKKPSVAVETNDDAARQVRRYGFTAKLKISVLSNFEYLLLYDCSVKVDAADNHHKAQLKKYHYTEFADKFDELRALLGKEAVYSGSFDEQWKTIEDKIDHFSVDTLFLNQINDWRKKLGAEIYKYQPTISEQLLNDCVQSYINRIIFLRVCEDRNQEVYETLLHFASKKDFAALIAKFTQADKKYNSGLFEQYLSTQIIGDISSVFWVIIKQLYYPDSPYSFAVFSSDILGSIYEIFLSEKLTIKGGLISLEKKPENTDRDVVTTPVPIIRDILSQTVVPYCQGKSDQEIIAVKAADIACGSGAFIIELFQLLSDILIDYYLQHDRSKLIQTSASTYRLPFAFKKQLLLNCIYGTDKDFNAVEAAKFGLLLKLLEGESNETVAGSLPVLPDLSGNIHFGNTLIHPSDLPSTNYDEVNPFDFGLAQYDIIVGNPPYMKSEDMKRFTPLELPIYKTKYQTAHKQFDKYFLFIEQGIKLLKDGGYLGYIVPAKFFQVGAGLKLRALLASNGYLNTIVSFGANQVFQDKTTYTCLLTLKKTAATTFNYTEVADLKQWRIQPLNSVNFVSEQTADLDNDCWVLIPPHLKSAYQHILSISKPLAGILGDDKITNGIQTSLNPVYIITKYREDNDFVYFVKEGTSWQVEKELVRPYYNTPSAKPDKQKFQTYIYLQANAYVLFPYRNAGGQVEIIPEADLQANYPFAFQYVKHYETKIRKRDVSPPIGNDDWYKFGRSQHLNSWDAIEKIIVGVLSTGGKYPIDLNKTIVSSGGTAGYCILAVNIGSPYSIYYLQALLNSKYVEWFSSLYGEVFRGGYIARGTKVLKRLPIRAIDFTNSVEKALHDQVVSLQLSLIKKQEEINSNFNDKRKLTILNRAFESLKAQMDLVLENLFGLGNEDHLIPKIK